MMIVTKNPNKKGNKQNKIIAALVVAIVAVLIFSVVMIVHFTGNNANEPVTELTTQTEETFPEIVIENHITENTEETKATEKEAEVLKLQEPQTTKNTTQKPTQQQTSNVKPAEPVKPANPGSTPPKSGEVVVDGNDSVKEYSCGVKGHHCDSKETHNFIVSLEQKGCPYCGSHSCKSFYTYDEWGNACYDPTKCESYSVKNDPCETCQECGKKVGDGSKGACVRFNVDMKCPVCGKTVKAKTCHSH